MLDVTYPFNPAIARYDDHAAARIFQYLCRDPQSERAVARLFATSILAAHETAPSSWEVTLDRQYVRLNVGPVAALSLHEDGPYMYVAKPLHVARAPDCGGGEFRRCTRTAERVGRVFLSYTQCRTALCLAIP